MANSKEKKETQHVMVVARLRPFNNSELECGAKKCLEINGRDITLQMAHGTKRYTFDRVFDMTSKQEDVYNTIVGPMIKEIMQGYNCTVFAYGQTGTGKTYTMVGNHSSVGHFKTDPHLGIIPRTLDNLFMYLSKNADVDFTVRASYLELYNEVLIDLLSCEEKTLKIYEDPKNKGSVRVHGLEEVTVFSKEEVFDILEKGSDKRMTAATLMNSQSSRSHTVFTLTLHSRELTPDGEELVKTGKLNLVDLAGSENITKSGAIDKRAREAGSINQSLLTLGRVIKALVENSAHIPYRESKLTRILQDSLGGKTKTAIIATVSPASNNLEETMSTLDYAFRARNITNRPEVNQRMSKQALIHKYVEEIDRLKKDVLAARGKHGIYMNPENYDLMMRESEKQKESLLKAISEISIFEGRLKELERMQTELEEVYLVTKSELQEATADLQRTKPQLKKLLKERRLHQALIDQYDEAQTAFHQHSKALSETLDKYIKDQEIFRGKLNNLYSIMEKNENVSHELLKEYKHKNDIFEDFYLSSMATVKIQSDQIMRDLRSSGYSTNHIFDSYNLALDHCQGMIQRVHSSTKDTMDKLYTNFSSKIKLSSRDCKTLLKDHCLSLKEMSDTLTRRMSMVSSIVESYKKKVEDEQISFRLEIADIVAKTIDVSNNCAQSYQVIFKNIQNFKEEFTSKSCILKESSDNIRTTYDTVDSIICDSLDNLSTGIVSKISLLKEDMKSKHKVSMNNIIGQQKMILVDHDKFTSDFISNMQKIIEKMTLDCETYREGLSGNLQDFDENIACSSSSRESSFDSIVTQVNVLKSMVGTYQEQEEERSKKSCEELEARSRDVLEMVQNEQVKVLNEQRVSLNLDEDHLSTKQSEMQESIERLMKSNAELENRVTELLEKSEKDKSECLSKVEDLLSTVESYTSAMTFLKREGNTPKGKHSVVTATPKRVSKNLFSEISSDDEEDDFCDAVF